MSGYVHIHIGHMVQSLRAKHILCNQCALAAWSIIKMQICICHIITLIGTKPRHLRFAGENCFSFGELKSGRCHQKALNIKLWF